LPVVHDGTREGAIVVVGDPERLQLLSSSAECQAATTSGGVEVRASVRTTGPGKMRSDQPQDSGA
jgi:predicted nicotinamide N-methyase